MIMNQKEYSEKIEKMLKEYVYNIGKSSEVGAQYILKSIKNKIEEKKGGK